MSLALARKYRPRDFASVAVQSHVSSTLRGAIARGRVAHGYLLCGPRGVGKTTLARVLAMALNCENRSDSGEPCGRCPSCERIWSGSASLDVVEIDAASNRGVDDARELRERAMYAPSGEDRYKVYIVDEAHMLTREAWNALLKILEEPPPRVVFVFATTEPQKIAQAAAPVLSRLQRFDFKRMGTGDIRERLAAVLDAEGVTAEPDALAMLARAADGSMRDALSLTDQVLSLGEGRITADRVRDALGLVAEDEYLALLDIVAERRAGDVFAAVGRLADAGVDFGLLLTGLADMLRAQLALSLGGSAPDVSERTRAALAERRDRLAPADLLRMLTAITELEPRFRKSGQQQLLLETLLVRFALMDRTVSLEEVLRGIGGSSGGSVAVDTPARGASGAATARETADRGGRRNDSAGESTLAPADRLPARPASRVSRADREEPTASAPSSAGASSSLGGSATALAVEPVTLAPARLPAASASLELNVLVEKWDEVVAHVRRAGKSMLATALEHALPIAVSARGDVSLQLDDANEMYERAFENGRAETLAALRATVGAAERVVLRVPEAPAGRARPRMTEESVRAERTAMLRRRDPVLGAAIDALDLELLD